MNRIIKNLYHYKKMIIFKKLVKFCPKIKKIKYNKKLRKKINTPVNNYKLDTNKMMILNCNYQFKINKKKKLQMKTLCFKLSKYYKTMNRIQRIQICSYLKKIKNNNLMNKQIQQIMIQELNKKLIRENFTNRQQIKMTICSVVQENVYQKKEYNKMKVTIIFKMLQNIQKLQKINKIQTFTNVILTKIITIIAIINYLLKKNNLMKLILVKMENIQLKQEFLLTLNKKFLFFPQIKKVINNNFLQIQQLNKTNKNKTNLQYHNLQILLEKIVFKILKLMIEQKLNKRNENLIVYNIKLLQYFIYCKTSLTRGFQKTSNR